MKVAQFKLSIQAKVALNNYIQFTTYLKKDKVTLMKRITNTVNTKKSIYMYVYIYVKKRGRCQPPLVNKMVKHVPS